MQQLCIFYRKKMLEREMDTLGQEVTEEQSLKSGVALVEMSLLGP